MFALEAPGSLGGLCQELKLEGVMEKAVCRVLGALQRLSKLPKSLQGAAPLTLRGSFGLCSQEAHVSLGGAAQGSCFHLCTGSLR